MFNNFFMVAITGILLLAQSCSFIPEYKRPDLPVEKTWSGETPLQEEANEKTQTGSDGSGDILPASLAWQAYFKSETLREIIIRALDNNRDLRVALLNIEKARAAYRIQKAEILPVISGNAGTSQQRISEDNSATGSSYTSDTAFSANLGMTAYELDLFGRVRSLNENALEIFLATEEAAMATRIALIAQTADSYITMLAHRKLLTLAENTFKAHKETYDVINNQYEVGSATRLALAQAATTVENARASIARYRRFSAQAENALTLLAGTSVETLLHTGETIDDICFIGHLPEGLPSQILLARPDIRAAEHRLKASNADIGAARAALYPTITLTGTLGVSSQSLTSLFDMSDSLAWGFSPSISIPIFNREGINASLESAKVSEKIAAAKYEGAVQQAFKEVADQLDARKTYKDQLDAQNALVAASHEAFNLSKARYENGVDDFLAVLDSQRALFTAQQEAIAIRRAYLSNLINLYKVMGGGQIDAM